MDLVGTGGQLWPLTTGNNDNPTLTQGKPTSFFCNTVPDRCPTAPLAYYLPVVLLTIYATLNQPASGASTIAWDRLPAALLDSIDWITAWHGTVVSANHVFGSQLNLVEFYSNGFRYAARRRPPYPTTTGAYPVEYTFAVTPSVSRLGRLMADTAQLALLFQTSQLKINIAASSVLDGLSTGATFTNLSARASAVLVPRNELVLGTPVETILHQVVAGSNSNQVQIKGFGTDTMLTGVESKGGVVWLGELTTANGQGGAFAAENVTQFSFPWRGQTQMQHVEGFVSMNSLSNMVNDRANTFPTVVAGGDGEFNNPPYGMDKSDQNTTTSTHMDLTKLLAWIMVQGGNDLALSDLQTAYKDESYFLTVTGGFTGATHLILAMYARQWTETMRTSWVKKITAGGANGMDSLASYVLGGPTGVAKAQMHQRTPHGKHYLTADNLAYLPYQFS
jgi:hypothetical protein